VRRKTGVAGCEECARLSRENERLKARVGELEAKLEESRRVAKRQAAPFSRGRPADRPSRPGRKSGSDYGRKAHRPAPDEVDETVDAPLPEGCSCGGEIEFERVAFQYQEELPEPAPIRRCVKVFIGRCRCCGRRHQGRHPYQTSDALGAAASQLGPRAVATITQLNQELGLSPQKTAKTLERLGGIKLTPGGVVQAVARQARSLEATYDALVEGVRASRAVAPDETGWRVEGRKAWLWTYVGDGVTVYQIAVGRGYDEASVILGENYDGVLERDGWAPYRRFEQASHQSCYAHLLRRTSEMISDSIAGQARVPHQLRRILKDGLALRDARDQGDLTQVELDDGVKLLDKRIEALLACQPTYPPNLRLLRHLRNERGNLTTFLTTPGVQATNWRAEQALRPAIVNRKNWGGNRTWAGARTQQVTMSVIRSARQQHVDPIKLMLEARLAPTPTASDLLKFPVRAAPT
jgi:transposase